VADETPEIRVALDEKDFRGLVNGEIVSVEGFDFRGIKLDIKMILKDIGWDRMAMAIRDAIEGHAVDGPGDDTTKTEEDSVGDAEGRSVSPQAEGEDRETEDSE
jgi:hypothetical protein